MTGNTIDKSEPCGLAVVFAQARSNHFCQGGPRIIGNLKLDHVVRSDVAGTATVGGVSPWRVDKQNDELATTAGQRSKSNLAGLQLDGWLPGGDAHPLFSCILTVICEMFV
ncbi:hypothetical protein MRX96_019646 [Rhipicephalus microplus]